MRKTNRWIGLTASFIFTLCLCSAKAAIFDAGQALKADMAQGSPANPYADTNGGVWTYGQTTAVAGGTLTAFSDTNQYWDPALKGFSGPGSLPTLHVNTSATASSAGGLATPGYLIVPGEIALHPNDGNTASPYAIARLTVPHTGVYHILATFRDTSAQGDPSQLWAGVEAHVVVNGSDITNAVVSADAAAPAGSVQVFTADVRSISLSAGSTVDFVVGPTGTGNGGSYYNDGTALRASVTAQTPYQAEIINLDFNGYGPEDSVPGTNQCYSGAAAVGAAGDFWNSAALANFTFAELTAPQLKLADGIINSTVRFSMRKAGGLLHGDCREIENSVNPLIADYVYILNGDTPDTNTFTISGLVPNAAYDLFFYSHAGADATPGRFVLNGIAYDSVNTWFVHGDYAACAGIAADADGVITGIFGRADPGNAGVINGLQIVGTFPRSHAEMIGLDINGFNPPGEYPPGVADAYSGAARVGAAGDYWNRAAIAYATVAGIKVPSLKLTDGITNSTACFSLSATGGGLLTTDRVFTEARTQNALMDDYVDMIADSTNRFTISGLVPHAAYDLYFYCRAGKLYRPGRFIINGVNYDSINQVFPFGPGNWDLVGGDNRGGDTAVCAGITADGDGAISGDFCRIYSGFDAVFNGLQIVGTFPRQHVDLVNLDINGFYTGQDVPPVAGDTYAGAAAVGAAGDFWNGVTIGDAAVAGITSPHLKLPDGLYNSTVTFSISKVGGGLLGADRIDSGASANRLLDDYVYFTGTVRFTISGLVPDTAYDLYFYSHAGIYYMPVRISINSLDYYYSFDKWYPTGEGGDYAVCAGITANGNGEVTGDLDAAIPGGTAILNGLQIIGAIPRIPLGTVITLH